MNQIIQAPAQERVLVTDDRTSGWRSALNPKQMGASWVKNVIFKFMSPKQKIFDTCPDTFALPKASVLLQRHSCFLGFVIDTIFFKGPLLGIGQAFV